MMAKLNEGWEPEDPVDGPLVVPNPTVFPLGARVVYRSNVV